MDGCRIGEGCSTYGRVRAGLCERHYRAFKLYGDPLVRLSNKGRSPAGRFWMKVNKDAATGCWLWTGKVQKRTGYGNLSVDRRDVLAHRFAYELLVGPIPEGLVVDHLCRVRHCVNPDHIEVVTQAENIRRGIGLAAKNAAKTHCLRGHPFDEANTRWDSPTHRGCRTCDRERMRRVRAKAKSE